MENVLPRTKEVIQEEILNLNGHQEWNRLTVHDFGDNNVEFSLMPYETWSEIPEEDLHRPVVERGKGDRDKSTESSCRRSKRIVRHKCKLLKARYMITLTTKEIITDLSIMQRYFQEFVRRIRKVTDFQYVLTYEYQKRGALHLHVAVANRQDYKLLWSVWFRVVGKDKGRVHVTSGNKKANTNKIAAYISKYISKDFQGSELNKKRFWSSLSIGKVIKTVYLLRPDWDMVQILLFIKELCHQHGVRFHFGNGGLWQNLEKGLFWMEASG